MSDQFEAILDECISALQAGVSIEEVLAEVPDYASELRPMLYMATLLANPNPALIPTEQKQALRAKYMAEVAALPPPPAPSWAERAEATYHIIKRRLTPKAVLSDLVTVTITAFLTIILSLFILSYVATDTIPGDLLYRFKRLGEQVQLALTFNETNKTDLNYEFNQRRIHEIETMISLGRVGTVEFKGVLESKGQNLWLVEGYPIILPEEVMLEGDPQVGDTLHVVGFLRTNRDLVADRINIE